MTECRHIQELLALYETASGQKLNKDKTAIFFSKNTPQQDQNAIKNLLHIPAIRSYEKYLGLPSFIGRSKKICFSQIKERVWSKLKGWKEKLLSQSGREILIKAVAQSIPTYAMSCFKLPIGLCNDLKQLMRDFWWGYQGEKRKIH